MKKIVIPAVVVLGVGIGAYLISTNSKTENNKAPESSQESPANSRPALPTVPTAVVQSESVMFPKTEAAPNTEENKVWADFKYRADLERYLGIRKKVLMAENEQRDRQDLLQDRALIQSLRPLLLVEASQENISLQNAALDYLFEALEKGAREEVAGVLKAVVSDASIENNSKSMSSREALAGIKAEVLLNWSSLDPAADAQIEASLPGPVSKKIWDNVKKHQDNNVAESQTLQARK